jgi:DNA-binding NtrC family response regulator
LALEGSRAEGVTLSQALATTRLKDSVARATTYEGARREFDRGYYTELNIKHAGNVSKIAEEAGRERSTVRTLLRALGLRTDVPADQDPKRKPSSAARRARLPAKKR